MKITSEMVRAARALLRWDQTDLARYADVSLPTVKRVEKQPGPLGGRPATIGAVTRAFEKFGIEFLFDDGVGVRLRAEGKKISEKR